MLPSGTAVSCLSSRVSRAIRGESKRIFATRSYVHAGHQHRSSLRNATGVGKIGVETLRGWREYALTQKCVSRDEKHYEDDQKHPHLDGASHVPSLALIRPCPNEAVRT